MSEDYLWDRTDKPDPEIQQLEEVLGTLRYQPRPLNIPAGFEVERAQSFFRRSAPRLAIAATIAVLLFGLGLWLGLHRLKQNQQPQSVAISNSPAMKSTPVPAPTANTNPERLSSSSHDELAAGLKDGNVPKVQRHGSATRSGASLRNQLLALKKRHEAEAAKDQLMLALRLASAKLNFVQKKTLNSRDEIHNQHKIG